MRDPRDVLLSQKLKWKRRYLGAKSIPLREAIRSRINYHPIIISKLWNSSIRLLDRLPADVRIHKICFEELLRKPDLRQLKKLKPNEILITNRN